jgi:hypothetical protein
VRFGELHWLYATTSDTSKGLAARGLGKPTTSRRRELCTRRFAPSERLQIMTAFASTAGPLSTWGSNATCPPSEIVCGPPKLPAGGRTAAWMRPVPLLPTS